MDRTKKQHYVSQSILYVFFKVKKIHEYNLKINKDYDSSVENSMCCSDIYECDLYDDNSLEKAFAALYDGEFAKRLKEIDNFLNNNEISKAKEQIKNSYNYFLISYYKSLASLVRLSKNDRYELEQNSSTLRMLKNITDLHYMKRLSLILCNCYTIYIVKSSNSNFILCDQFIATASNFFNGMFSNISNRDIGVKGSMIFLPISSDYYAILFDKNMSFEYDSNLINFLSREQTEKINNIIYNNATEKVVTKRNEKYNFNTINSCGDEMCFFVYSNHHSKGWKTKKEIFYSDYEQSIYLTFRNLEWGKYINLGRNEKCYCGSGKKFKKCCFDKTERCKTIMSNIKNNSINSKVLIDNNLGLEKHVEL